MRKLILLVLMFMAVALAGCLPQSQASPTSTATSIARIAPTSVVTVPAQAILLPDSSCTVVTKKPTPGPTVESIYPPATSTEWVKGPASAKVTIIEYSDFQ
jgi:protein-disulfide isomerase